MVHLPTTGNASYCGYIINAGTRDEMENEYGMAHFVEHMLFKGTAKRKSYHIINRIENVGGELNAYTNKEETVLYSVFLEEHFERAFELLTDLTFHSIFPQNEIDKEIEVILDEINSYEDSPSELIFDEFENIVFRKSQLGHNILGDTGSLQNFDTEKTLYFVKRMYYPENMVFFSVGKTDPHKIIRIGKKYIDKITSNSIISNRKVPANLPGKKTTIEKDTNQAHVLIGGKCYDIFDKKRRILHLLNNILGGPGMNSRLNMSLREKRGYVYNVESNVTHYTDTGIFSIYFGSDKRNMEKCISLIEKELKWFRETNLSTSQLSAAKKQLIGQIGIARDNHENLALSLGKSFFHFNHFNDIKETITKIDSITGNEILEVANEIFDDKNLNYLIYV